MIDSIHKWFLFIFFFHSFSFHIIDHMTAGIFVLTSSFRFHVLFFCNFYFQFFCSCSCCCCCYVYCRHILILLKWDMLVFMPSNNKSSTWMKSGRENWSELVHYTVVWIWCFDVWWVILFDYCMLISIIWRMFWNNIE